MTDREGILRRQPSGRWAVCRPGRDPDEVTTGRVFRIEVAGALRVTRMEHIHGKGYYSVHDYSLRDGLRAVIGAED